MFDSPLAAVITHLGASSLRDTDWMHTSPSHVLLRLAATFALLGGLLTVLEFGTRAPAETPPNDLPITSTQR